MVMMEIACQGFLAGAGAAALAGSSSAVMSASSLLTTGTALSSFLWVS